MRGHPGLLLQTAVATAVFDHGLRRAWTPGGRQRWERLNHRGDVVTLLEGVALVLGSTTALSRLDPAAALVSLGVGLTGAADDLRPDATRKGLTGHLGALSRGTLSVGALKVLGLSACGALAAVIDRYEPRTATTPKTGDQHAVRDVLVRAAVVAGSANLANLLDLRPGRALKVALLTGIPLSLAPSGAPAAAAVGAASALLPGDLRGDSMLGDTGANPLGALVGLALARSCSVRGRGWVLVGLITLTLVSERVSFTRVIEATPVLREVDAWGRISR